MELNLEAYLSKAPEIVFEWNDSETDAKGWVVINSLKNGAAGGGTRMRKGLSKDEVISLAKVMEIKFTVSGPAIGGAKSGIDFDPDDPGRIGVLKRWYAAVFPLLKNYYGTGGDLNVDELKDVIPITEDLGLWHPQEGVVNGHFNAGKGEKVRRLGQLRFGVSKIIEDPLYGPVAERKLAVADMITGWGVSESIHHYYDIYRNASAEGEKAIIQGWGNVASAAAYYLSQRGVKIVGIIDKAGGIIAPEGLSAEKVKQLFIHKKGNQIQDDKLLSFEEVNDRIWDTEADIFVPGAASKIVSRSQMKRMLDKGLTVMSCGANVPFVDDKVFFGETAAWVDQEISLIPDFIANCGMARAFAFLMQANVEITDETIFSDASQVIRNALIETYELNTSDKDLFKRAINVALNKATI